MSSTRSVFAPPVFAEDASTVIPPTPIAGVSYRDPVAGPASSPDGWPYAERVNSAEFNQIMYQLSSLISIMDKQGILGWSDEVDYEVPALVFGSNGLPYIALQASGPSSTPRDPVSEPTYWEQFASHGMVVISAAGVTNWTVPLAMRLGIIKPIVYTVGAGGGSGAAQSNASYNAAGGGGGGGGTAIECLDLTGVTSVAITIGAGGTAGVAGGAAAGAGGTSSFGAFMSCTGGAGGNAGAAVATSSSVGLGGGGGVGSGGQINANGESGHGGVAASPSVAGGTASGGPGGGSFFSGPGAAGAGATGAHTTGGSQNINGTAGSNGLVVIQW